MIMRKTAALLLATLLLLTACACGKSAGADIDPEAAADRLVEEITFRDPLIKADQDYISSMYQISDKVESCAVYVSTSFTGEEVAVVKMKDAADANEALLMLEQRRADLIFQLEDYRPDEMPNLNNPVIVIKEPVVIMVLADDFTQAETAAKAIS